MAKFTAKILQADSAELIGDPAGLTKGQIVTLSRGVKPQHL
jgi:hypothetical protein